ncbi:MAG: hypothetical protein IT164_05800 [Bryobacterales bacterium]|nr:hypothetical protein [Bryobacterales bacterium]
MKRRHWVAGVCYLVLALCIWLPYGAVNGMPYETTLVWNSETTPFPQSMLYADDALRPFTSVFYDLGYRLSVVLGVQGSYLGIQLVYLALLWARAYLLYLGVAALTPGAPWLSFLAGVFMLVNAADLAAMWVGQLNQYGYMFWLALAFWAMVRGTEPDSVSAKFSALALVSGYLCLYSYESPIFLLSLLPVLLGAVDRRRVRQHLVLHVIWYSLIAHFTYRFLLRYYLAAQTTYQAKVMRQEFALWGVLREWAGQVGHSIFAWRWGTGPHWPELTAPVALAVIAFAGAAWLLRREEFDVREQTRVARRALPVGLLACIFSFPAYLFLPGGGGLWRTQFLSAFGAGVALAALVLIVAAWGRPGKAMAAMASLLILCLGVDTLVDDARAHWRVWERHRGVMAGLLAVAPAVAEGTAVILTGVPRKEDPFGDNMWFDFAVRLAYPGRQVIGAYQYSDGGVSPSYPLDLEREPGKWVWNGKGMPPLVTGGPAESVLLAAMDGDGRVRLLNVWPANLPAPESMRQRYKLHGIERVGGNSPIAVNRFGPIPESN